MHGEARFPSASRILRPNGPRRGSRRAPRGTGGRVDATANAVSPLVILVDGHRIGGQELATARALGGGRRRAVGGTVNDRSLLGRARKRSSGSGRGARVASAGPVREEPQEGAASNGGVARRRPGGATARRGRGRGRPRDRRPIVSSDPALLQGPIAVSKLVKIELPTTEGIAVGHGGREGRGVRASATGSLLIQTP